MRNDVVFDYVLPNGSKGSFSLEDIQNMTLPTFMSYKDYFVNVRDVTRYDTAVFEAVDSITPQHKIELFRKGIGQEEKFATSDTTYMKTEFHTNMPRNGEVPAGGLWIVYDIAAPADFSAGKPTTMAAGGQITNAKASFVATNDPALILSAWLNQTKLNYREGSSEDSVVRGLLKDFPANSGISGFLGSSVGGIAQNLAVPNVNLRSPRILQGGEEFTVEISPLCNFDTSSATGINQIIRQKVELKVIELVKLPA